MSQIWNFVLFIYYGDVCVITKLCKWKWWNTARNRKEAVTIAVISNKNFSGWIKDYKKFWIVKSLLPNSSQLNKVPRVTRVPERPIVRVPFKCPSAQVPDWPSTQVPWKPECPSAFWVPECFKCPSAQVPWLPECPSALRVPRVPWVPEFSSIAWVPQVPKCPSPLSSSAQVLFECPITLNGLSSSGVRVSKCLLCLEGRGASVSWLISQPVSQLVYNVGSVS